MPATRTLTEPEQADRDAEDAQYYRRVLHGLIDRGADLARQVHEQASSQAQPASDAAIAFDRIARAVRRTIALARKVAEPMPVRAEITPAQHRQAARRRIIREVEDTLQRNAEPTEAESLHEELLDRLDSPDVVDDIGHRPVAEIIADICHDLGLAAPRGTHPWKRRTPSDIAILCARAAATTRHRPATP